MICALALTGLVAITSAKDNVHFGSVTLHNPQENHYVWGFLPTTEIKGKATGNFRTYGLLFGQNELGKNSQVTGNMSLYTLVGGNTLGDNSSITGNIISKGLYIKTPMSWGVGSDVEIGLENYVPKK